MSGSLLWQALSSLLIGLPQDKFSQPISPLPKKPKSGVFGKSSWKASLSAFSCSWKSIPLPTHANMKAILFFSERPTFFSLWSSFLTLSFVEISVPSKMDAAWTLGPEKDIPTTFIAASSLEEREREKINKSELLNYCKYNVTKMSQVLKVIEESLAFATSHRWCLHKQVSNWHALVDLVNCPI